MLDYISLATHLFLPRATSRAEFIQTRRKVENFFLTPPAHLYETTSSKMINLLPEKNSGKVEPEYDNLSAIRSLEEITDK